jgi:uncharacterized protein GlcG (DUF336 family)
MRVRQWSLLTMLLWTWASSAFAQLTEADVRRIITQAATRAAQISPRSVIAVTDREGYVLGVWNVRGGMTSTGEIATCVSKAGTAAFLSSDQNAFTSRTAGFIIQQHFPPGVNNTPTGPLVGVGLSNLFFSDVNHFKRLDGHYSPVPYPPCTITGLPCGPSPGTLGSPILGTSLDGSPGGVPLYKNGHLVGGVGVTGDGTPQPPIPFQGQNVRAENPFVFIAGYDKDEDVALAGQKGYKPSPDILASNVYINGISLEYTESSTSLPNSFVLPGNAAAGFPIQGSPAPFSYPVATFGGVQGQIRQPIISDPLPGTINGQARLTAAEVRRIISFAADRARTTRAGIRLPIGTQMQVFITVVNFPNQNGVAPTVLGTFRTGEATLFSWDVAVQKARTAIAYSNNGNRVAMSTRTVGFLAQSHYPPGIDADRPGPFFGQQEIFSGFMGTAPNVIATGPFPPNPNLPNGITIFPGGFPLYRNGQLIGAIGVSGDGVDQDDIVGASGTHDFPAPEAIQADSVVFRGARLPYAKFPRDPTGVTRSNDAVIMSSPHALMAHAGLANVSSRTNVGLGDNVMIAGFVITGQSPKKILLRGLGPSLAQFHLTNVLSDPILELHKPGGAVVVNDDWKSTQQSEIQATGSAPASERDSALVLTLNPGTYSAVLRGKNGTTGVGLVEVYDLTPTSNSMLTNISTRGFVGTMNNLLIGGFIVGANSGAARVLIRAVGPSLSRFGINHPLADPMLEIHNANGAMITTNDDWGNSQFAEISANALAPSDPRESAILGWLPSGAYTAVVRGKNQTTGLGLIEAYCTQ